MVMDWKIYYCYDCNTSQRAIATESFICMFILYDYYDKNDFEVPSLLQKIDQGTTESIFFNILFECGQGG